MRKAFFAAVLALAILTIWALPQDLKAFCVTASDFSGYLAYDKSGDVIGNLFHRNQPLNYGNTGRYFNVAAGLRFDFEYCPGYPSIRDMRANPNTDWNWTVSFKRFHSPFDGSRIPDFQFSHTASFNDIRHGMRRLGRFIHNRIPFDFAYNFDYRFLSHNTGMARFDIAANIDPRLLPSRPPQFRGRFDFPGEISLTASQVPEPITLVLFGAGLVGVKAVHRSRRKKS